jgi:lipoic acid synthetase
MAHTQADRPRTAKADRNQMAKPDRNRTAKPSWLKAKMPAGANYTRLRDLMRSSDLHTVCEEAHCPNLGECWDRGTATFLILGDVCTRACSYCQISSGRPASIDVDEPRRVAQAVQRMRLRHAVITSVNRDDVADGGASIFVELVRWIRRLSPETTIELLIPDFDGNFSALESVLDSGPEILNHNMETVPRLFPEVRHQGDFERSLEILRRASDWSPPGSSGPVTKSGLMVGLGETMPELNVVLERLREVDCDVLTVGQYLRPSSKHRAVDRYVTPEEFASIKERALGLGFRHVESGPLVRSSYHAESQIPGRGAIEPSLLVPLMDDRQA